MSLLLDEQNTAPSWDQLRKEARQLENEIEHKLSALARIGQSTGLDNTGQEAETDELLKKVHYIKKKASIKQKCSFKMSFQKWQTSLTNQALYQPIPLWSIC